MNTAIYTETGSNVGIGFALPVDVINAIVPQIIKQGTNEPPMLGVLEAEQQVKDLLRATGVVIDTVEPGSGAEKAGLRSMEQLEDGSIRADVIVAVAGKPVTTTAEIRSVLAQHSPGEKVSVEIQRGRERLAVDVVLQAR
jgi:2-alkenal reductase